MPPKKPPKTQDRTRREEKLAYDSDCYDDPAEDPVSGRLRQRPSRKMAPVEPDTQVGMSGNTLIVRESSGEPRKVEEPITNKKRPGRALENQGRQVKRKISQGNSTGYQILQGVSRNHTLCKIGKCKRSFAKVKQWKDHARDKHPEYMKLRESERRRELDESLHHDSDVGSSRIASGAVDEISRPADGEHEDLILRGRHSSPEDNPGTTPKILGRDVGNASAVSPIPESSTSEWCHCKVGSCQKSFSNTKLMDRHIRSKHRKYWKRIQSSRQQSSLNNRSESSPSHHSLSDATEVADVVSHHTYGEGGREDFIPRDGTFLTRLVGRLSGEGKIQKTEDCAAMEPYSGSHHAKGHEKGGDGDGEVMNKPEEVRTQKHVEQKSTGKAKAVGQPRKVTGSKTSGA